LALLVRPFRWPYELRAEKQVAAKQTSCQLKPSRSLALPYAVYELNHSGPGLHAAECGPGQRPPPRGVLATVDGRPQNCHAPRSASPMCSTTLDMRPLTSQIVQTGMCSEIEFRVRRRNRAACMPVAEVFILHAGISGRVCSEASAKDSTNTRRHSLTCSHSLPKLYRPECAARSQTAQPQPRNVEPRPRWRQVQLGQTSRPA